MGHLAWPITILALGVVLRRQIGDFLSAIAGRVTGVSVFAVSFELAVATEVSPPWRSRHTDADVRGLVIAQDVNDSYFDSLRQTLLATGSADFIVIDLKSDGRQEWLTSRLSLFTYLLSRLKGVKAVVFVATRGDTSRTFLGIVDASDLVRVLGQQDARLRLAWLQTEAEQVGRLVDDGALGADPLRVPPTVEAAVPLDVDHWWGGVASGTALVDPLYVARRFLSRMQWQPQSPIPPDVPAGWLQLPEAPGRPVTWEHASWIEAAHLTDGFLAPVVRPDDCLVDNSGWSSSDRVRAVASARGEFVALLSPSYRFERLVDRRALLEELGRSSVEAEAKP
ncbi:hypothetical protein [Nocardioides endophyticus]|uniref:hypothetical protein n=1 Tax=Nocardioides endophyticus TaxID=1353775 RepID=UPI0031E58907